MTVSVVAQSIDRSLASRNAVLSRSNTLLFELGDARNISRHLKEPVDVTITSPPYYGLKDYGVGGQIGHEKTYEDYLSTLVGVFNDVYAHTKNSGSLWLILDAFKQGGILKLLPFDLGTDLAQSTKWKMKDAIIWNKKKTLPWSQRGNLRHTHEYILFFTKSSNYKFHLDRIREPGGLKDWWHDFPERYNPNGKSPSDIWDIMIPTQGGWGKPFLEHFCPFPPELVERIVLLTTNKANLVFDPFGGSGVVLAVASVMGRRGLGIEIKEEYIKKFWDQVLPEIRRMWADRKAQLLMTQRTQLKFRNAITTLRQIKFAKVLRKKILGQTEIKPPVLLISHVGRYRRPKGNEKPIASELTLVYLDSSQKPSGETISNLCKAAPLKSFGILPSFKIASITELNGSKERLWMYGNGSISRPLGSIDLADDKWARVVENSAGQNPPLLLANKKVDVTRLDKRLSALTESRMGWFAPETKPDVFRQL